MVESSQKPAPSEAPSARLPAHLLVMIAESLRSASLYRTLSSLSLACSTMYDHVQPVLNQDLVLLTSKNVNVQSRLFRALYERAVDSEPNVELHQKAARCFRRPGQIKRMILGRDVDLSDSFFIEELQLLAALTTARLFPNLRDVVTDYEMMVYEMMGEDKTDLFAETARTMRLCARLSWETNPGGDSLRESINQFLLWRKFGSVSVHIDPYEPLLDPDSQVDPGADGLASLMSVDGISSVGSKDKGPTVNALARSIAEAMIHRFGQVAPFSFTNSPDAVWAVPTLPAGESVVKLYLPVTHAGATKIETAVQEHMRQTMPNMPCPPARYVTVRAARTCASCCQSLTDTTPFIEPVHGHGSGTDMDDYDDEDEEGEMWGSEEAIDDEYGDEENDGVGSDDYSGDEGPHGVHVLGSHL